MVSAFAVVIANVSVLGSWVVLVDISAGFVTKKVDGSSVLMVVAEGSSVVSGILGLIAVVEDSSNAAVTVVGLAAVVPLGVLTSAVAVVGASVVDVVGTLVVVDVEIWTLLRSLKVLTSLIVVLG